MICPLCNGAGRIEVRPSPEQRLEKIQHMIGHGLSYQKIADALGIHKATVGYYVTRYNLRKFRPEEITNPDSQKQLKDEGLI